MVFKNVPFTEDLQRYVIDHSTPLDKVQRDLIARTAELYEDFAHLQISPEQGPFLTILTRLSGSTRAIELGTFTGFSALCIARGLPEGGELLCCDVNEEWVSLGVAAWEEANVAHKISVRIGPALDTLKSLSFVPPLDFAFIDADKVNYWNYHNLLIPQLRPGGLLVYDNVLYEGQVIDPDADGPAAAIRDFNRSLVYDKRVEVAMLAAGDGLTLAWKRI